MISDLFQSHRPASAVKQGLGLGMLAIAYREGTLIWKLGELLPFFLLKD